MPNVLGRLAPSAYVTNALLRRFRQTATWLPVIDESVAGATGGTSFDNVRSEDLLGDISNGIGWQAVVNGVTRVGFLPPQTIPVGVQESARHQVWTEQGEITYYEGPTVLYTPDLTLKKWDVLALTDGRRFLVSDELRPIQRFGVTLLNISKLEKRAPDSALYQIPLT